MQKRNEEIFGDISGAHVIADDLIIAASSEKQHDIIFRVVLDRAREKGVRYNKDKIQLKIDAAEYMGNVVTHEGLKPDDKKIEAIVNMPQPSDIPSLQRLLGMTKYLSQYIPNESTITAPLRTLLKKGHSWNWTSAQDEALAHLKKILSKAPVLTFYDVNKPVTIQSDASQSGLGACLMQDAKPIAYASRSMTSAEKNYAQIEKEMLSIVFAVQKFHQYIYGKSSIVVESDHKPIEAIMRKPLCKAPPRLQRLMLKLQPYDLHITFVPGKYMYMADTLSRAYLNVEPDDALNDELTYVIHTLFTNLPVTPAKLAEFKHATTNDAVLQKVSLYCQKGWPLSATNIPAILRHYWNIRDELHVSNGIVFKLERIVVPSSLQQSMLELIHESHMGIEKCKSRARTLLYWPRMILDIEDTVRNCNVCCKYRNNQQKEPLIPHSIPDERFQKVGIDIMSFRNIDYLVVVDYFSKFPEIAQLPDKTTKSVVEQCKNIFARHGIPLKIISDNMPFRSKEFSEFTHSWGIKSTTSSPEFSQSNGQVERSIQTIKNLFRKAHDDNSDPYLALLEFRNAAITGLEYSPAQILMSRRLRTKLPISSSLLKPKVVDVYDDLCARQLQQKFYHDRSAKPLPPLKKGDKVRFKKHNKWDDGIVCGPTSEPRSYVVRNAHGHIRRNRRHLFQMPQMYNANRARNDWICDHVFNTPPPHNHTVNASHSTSRRARNNNVNSQSRSAHTSSYGRRIRTPCRFDDYV